jgi:hypothetical protein
LAQKMQVGPCIPGGVQLEKAAVGPTSGPTWRLSHLVCTVPLVHLVVVDRDALGLREGQYHTTRPLAPSYSLHTVLLKFESYNDTPS